ncbi:MAG: transcription repressor NadR [Clostridium sp.]|uniref:transcription repressor NadR n=1 Tax=Clostridium sp. TaxID=1506 RepID=UPI0039E7BF4F
MNSYERRNYIKDILQEKEDPLKGSMLAEKLGVTRQIIVKDIAILRAAGIDIISTPKGYIISKNKSNRIKKVIAVCHKSEEIEDELLTIVKFGGIIEDVIIEHKLYGEIRGILMIKTIFDVENFISKLNKYEAEPLSILTGGVHIHTISVEDEDSLKNILNELNKKRYLVSD